MDLGAGVGTGNGGGRGQPRGRRRGNRGLGGTGNNNNSAVKRPRGGNDSPGRLGLAPAGINGIPSLLGPTPVAGSHVPGGGRKPGGNGNSGGHGSGGNGNSGGRNRRGSLVSGGGFRNSRIQPGSGHENPINHDAETGPRHDTTGNPKRIWEGPVFGFKRVHSFLDLDEDEVIMAIHKNVDDWEKLLMSDDLTKQNSDDFLVLLLYIVGEKICVNDSNVPKLQHKVLTRSLPEQFIAKLNMKCNNICMKVQQPYRHNASSNPLQISQSPSRILQNIHTFYNTVALKMPNTAVDVLTNCIPMAIAAVIGLDETDPGEKQSLENNFSELRTLISGLKNKKVEEKTSSERRKKFGLTEREDDDMHAMHAPDNFREIPVAPTVPEILSCQTPFLRTNKAKGAYLNADHYLDVQFRLLREDFIRPLKLGIQDYIKNRHDYMVKRKRMPLGNVRIYSNVKIVRAELKKDAFVYYIQLADKDFKKVKWDKSKRLLVGSLLVFTPDIFKTAYFGIVAIRDVSSIKKGLLGITWEGLQQPPWSRRQEFLMVECEVYFEAYRYTLQILQTLSLEEFPMYKFIVESSSEVEAPAYLQNTTSLLSMKSASGEMMYFSPLIENDWPLAKDLELDEKQYAAFQAALTKEFAIIQGPPGTGKTFLGLKITEVLLGNREIWKTPRVGPILVVCYTNHALDQFMEGILNIFETNNETPEMIRVGGRCQSETLEPYNLSHRRRRANINLGKAYYAQKGEAYNQVRYLQNNRAELMTEMMGLNDLKGIVDFRRLNIWTWLNISFPETLWTCLDNLRWYGILDSLFGINFSEDRMLEEWFTVKRVQPTEYKVYKNIATNSNATNGNKSHDDSDGEDYDLDELMANRILDDIYAEAETTAPRNVGRFLVYHPDFSIENLENKKHELFGQRKEIEKAEKNHRLRQDKLQDCDQKVKILENKQKFILKLFDSYNLGALDLPDAEKIIEQANETPGFSFYVLPRAGKWSLYFYVVDYARNLLGERINKCERELMEAEKALKEILRYGDGRLLMQTKVVGMTTTGAAKYNDLLKTMSSRIVIVEEAAEVLEAHIVTCITKHCQHLILIGDHQQLRPSTTVYDLAKHYHLDLSFFERMIKNNLNCYLLKTQHRMRPEIANLVVGTIYESLDNDSKVLIYPAVAGLRKNLYFITHQEHEKAESDSTSKSNEYEAKFLAQLCRYIVLQGYSTNRITVLTTYVGQMFLLKKEIGSLPTCNGVRVTCVDNYQGEENDIILLSLVRSNEQNKIGFLNIDNRVCVAISRAKHGLYICGNMTILASQSKTWKMIKEKLEEREEIGNTIDLECQIHGTITNIGCVADFKNVSEGGCLIPCETTLKCGHKCRMICHVIDREHTEYQCKLRCEKKCENQHQCPSSCFQKCKPCPVQMEKELPCSHTKMLACHVKEDSVLCMENVEKTLTCGEHKEIMACYRDTKDFKCKVRVDKKLICGHLKEAECHVNIEDLVCRVTVKKLLSCGHEENAHCFLDKDVIKCTTIQEKTFEGCEHKINIKCSEMGKPRNCKDKCSTRLSCGHACRLICHAAEDPGHLTYQCKKKCNRKCSGGHFCGSNHECHKPCQPCRKKVKKPLRCGHEYETECYEDVANAVCLQPCVLELACKHKCQNLCYQPCDPCMVDVRQLSQDCPHYQIVPCSEYASKRRCDERVRPKISSSCPHDTLVPCRLAETITAEEALIYCEFPCGAKFEEKVGGCGHRCKGTCSECEQGSIHQKCQEECKRPLVCGHICIFPCSMVCPPCEQPCTLICEHSKCRKICGEPCTDCNERCSYGCVHRKCSKLCGELCNVDSCSEPCPKKIAKCGHPCVGFCGEPCPTLCRDCDYDELTEIFFGFEEDEDSRFVLLEDCKHVLESQGIDAWMGGAGDNGEISAKRCPKCKSLVLKTRRYGNIIRTQLQQVMKVKEKVFGNQNIVQEKLRVWVAKIREDDDRNRFWDRNFPILKDYLLGKLADIVPFGPNAGTEKNRVIYKTVGQQTMESVELIAKHGEDAIHVLLKSVGMKNELYMNLRKSYKELFEKLMKRQIPLSAIEVRDFDLEFQRLYDLQQLYIRRSSPRFYDDHSLATPVYDKALRRLLSRGPYTKKIKEAVHALMKELEEILKTGLGISDRERREILAAFNLAQGRWFACPNGHPYVITECGGAMQEGTCNECGARIGGEHHRLRSDNRLAGEMDGAIAPLYPNMV